MAGGTFVNPCGGRRWRQARDGRIEVEGEGFPRYAPSSPEYENMARTWSNWAPQFRSASRATGVPAHVLLAFATVETGPWSTDPVEQATIGSHAGAIGVMQIMPIAARGYGRTAEQMTDPATNILTGAEIIADRLAEGFELPSVAAKYNAGPGRHCNVGRNEWNLFADHNYPRQVIQYVNAAIEDGVTSGVRWSAVAGAVAVVGAAAFAGDLILNGGHNVRRVLRAF